MVDQETFLQYGNSLPLFGLLIISVDETSRNWRFCTG